GAAVSAHVHRVVDACAPIQDQEHALLAVECGADRHAQIELPVRQPQPNATVLGETSLGDVQTGHDFYAAQHGGLVLPWRAGDVMQHTVDAVTHPQPVGRRLEVNVARAGPQRLEDHHVHELDHRRLVGEGTQVRDGLLLFGEENQIAAAEVRRL